VGAGKVGLKCPSRVYVIVKPNGSPGYMSLTSHFFMPLKVRYLKGWTILRHMNIYFSQTRKLATSLDYFLRPQKSVRLEFLGKLKL
jgi:hypothetical protein